MYITVDGWNNRSVLHSVPDFSSNLLNNLSTIVQGPDNVILSIVFISALDVFICNCMTSIVGLLAPKKFNCNNAKGNLMRCPNNFAHLAIVYCLRYCTVFPHFFNACALP